MDRLYRAYAENPQKHPIRIHGYKLWTVIIDGGARKSYFDTVALQVFCQELVKSEIPYQVV